MLKEAPFILLPCGQQLRESLNVEGHTRAEVDCAVVDSFATMTQKRLNSHFFVFERWLKLVIYLFQVRRVWPKKKERNRKKKRKRKTYYLLLFFC